VSGGLSRRVVRARYAALLVLSWVLGMPISAARAQTMPLPPEEAMALLTRIQQAARQLDYSGVFAHQQDNQIQSSRIVHVVDGTGERERIEVLDGQPRELLRHNDEVQCLVPEKKFIMKERRRGDRFPGVLADGAPDISGHYQISVDEAMHRVAGRDCQQVHIIPRDSLRYGYRLCLDAATNLLLKTQILAAHDTVIEQISFTSLQLGAETDMALLTSRWPISDWKIYEQRLAPTDLAAKGWRIAMPKGFALMEQVSRRSWRGKAEINQLLLSDGLSAISVFIEPYRDNRLDRQGLQGAGRQGAVNAYGMRIADFWLTALGEVPLATLQALAESTEYVPLSVSPQ